MNELRRERWAFLRRRPAPAVLLSLLFCVIVGFTLSDYGITWDEPTYYSSGLAHVSWLRAPTRARLNACWKPTHEHPPLAMIPGGLLRYVLEKKLGLMNGFAAFRLQSLIFVFLLHYALYSLVSESFGDATAVVASASLFILPRVFFHAHLAALDYPMTAMWVAVAYAFQRGLRSRRWMVAASLLMGLALLTKINAPFLYALLTFWLVVHFRKELRSLLSRPTRSRIKEHSHVVCGVLSWLAVPAAVFLVCWPWLWPHPVSRTIGYFAWHLGHFPILVHYLGRTYLHAPWHYPFVMTAVTVPLAILVPLLVGLWKSLSAPHRGLRLFLLLNALVALCSVAFLAPSKYGGVRLFLPAFPFLCAVAALGVREPYRLCARFGKGRVFVALYVVVFGVSAFHGLVRYHPHQSSYYNAILGGAKGAARNFETTYWGDAYHDVVPWIEDHAESTFWVPVNSDSLKAYVDFGMIRTPIRFAKREQADYLLLLMRQGHFTDELWRYYRARDPVFSVVCRGTLLAAVYVNEARKSPAPTWLETAAP